MVVVECKDCGRQGQPKTDEDDRIVINLDSQSQTSRLKKQGSSIMRCYHCGSKKVKILPSF